VLLPFGVVIGAFWCVILPQFGCEVYGSGGEKSNVPMLKKNSP
jgi:hypothetical protein